MEQVRERIRVEGVVQGVGFRPFVYSLATRAGLAGHVGNDPHGVFIEVEGDAQLVADFRASLSSEAPPLAVVERVSAGGIHTTGGSGFVIAESAGEGRRQALITPDTATCAQCLAEIFDPADRRYRYPFTNCTNCGPRFTIVRDIPYDRPYTTMSEFKMCGNCAAEYHDPAHRRFHAQPVCCPACGPTLQLYDPDACAPRSTGIAAIEAAAAALRAGEALAIKGLGGYHLAVDAGSAAAVGALRSRKHREDKAFAVMVANLEQARTLCLVDAAEEQSLTGQHCPIVLLHRREGAPVAADVAPGNPQLGLMLPYTPLHHLLAAQLDRPVVLTSGNVSDEPIAYEDADARARLAGIADHFLMHDRPIHTRTDDSVVRLFRGREMPLRRSRGYVPHPLTLPTALPQPTLACGAELKNTFCLARGSRAFVSHHIGDLENYETLRSFTEGISLMERLFEITPELVAHDLHPEYLSTKYALDREGVDVLGVQHHHAHVASCLADNGEVGPAIGVAFDGLGYGSDGAIWGGEFLVADTGGFERAGHLAYTPMPGGTAAITEPWRMAASYLRAAYGEQVPELAIARRNADRWEQVDALLRSAVHVPETSSAGRLFDAVGAIVGGRDRITYEGQAAVELERLTDRAERQAYPAGMEWPVRESGPFRVDGAGLVRAAADDLCSGVAPATVGGRFHNGVASMIVEGCQQVRDATGLGTVALSGGVFQNELLLHRSVEQLETAGFTVLVHRRVPTNDGGISFGQAAVAAAAVRLHKPAARDR